MPADLADIDRTIAMWRRQRPPLTAFTAWKAIGGKPWSEVTWRDVREMMVDIEAGRQA